MKPGIVKLSCVSWNIAGKYELFKSNILQTFIQKYDVICLTETHSIRRGLLKFKNFKAHEYPDVNCNYEHPRGGICLLIKQDKLHYVKSVKLLMTDFIETTFTNNFKLVSLYIPPVDSVYYDEQYIQLLCSEFMDSDEKKLPMMAMGDTNTRLGDLNSIQQQHRYTDNPDQVINENGKHFREMLFNTTSALPVNHLINETSKFDGGFTFCRNNKRSQIDWCLSNSYQMPYLNEFVIDRNGPDISDHKPIIAEVNINGEKSVDAILAAAIELNDILQNHSKIPVICNKNTDLQCLDNLLKIEVDKRDPSTMNSDDISQFLVTHIHRYGKVAKIPATRRTEMNDVYGLHHPATESVIEKIERHDTQKWKFLKECNDSKMMWNCINMKGEVNLGEQDDIRVSDLANHCSSKSKIDISQVKFDDITTDVINEELDKEIDREEAEEALASLNEKSKTSDGISKNCLKAIWSTILPMLLIWMNMIFKGGVCEYPKNWLNLVMAIAKKGRLALPKFVRYIFLMGIFEKLYQTILNKRLYKFLKIPLPQTAYQTGKGCNLHVMTIRLLKVLAVKLKQKLFIIFTDFEAAFDLVSRRLLFQKLVKLGVSATMLSVLISIYVVSQSVVVHNGEFSDFLMLLAGVKQGAPPSGTLYIAYTLGIFNLFDGSFNTEPLIGIYHLLMHADDILMLATSRINAVLKIECLIRYCIENFIKLQLAKCAMMCVNSKDEADNEPIISNGVMLKCSLEEVYLGSVITCSTKLAHDVEADIKHRHVNIVKFYAFLRSNRNAPVDIKLKVLEACFISSLLHNAETWADCKIERLEVLHRRMLKSILGVRMTTPSEFLHVELGVPSVKTYILVKQFNFWKKVVELSDSDPLMYAVTLGRRYKLKEVIHYDKLLEKYDTADDIISEYYTKVNAQIRKKAEENRSRYVTYLSINPLLGHPSSYKTIFNYKNVSMLAKLRTTTHNLQIDMGRRTKTPRERRTCHCGSVEDEEHFLLKCHSYIPMRIQHNINNNTTISNILGENKLLPYINSLYEARKLYHA